MNPKTKAVDLSQHFPVAFQGRSWIAGSWKETELTLVLLSHAKGR